MHLGKAKAGMTKLGIRKAKRSKRDEGTMHRKNTGAFGMHHFSAGTKQEMKKPGRGHDKAACHGLRAKSISGGPFVRKAARMLEHRALEVMQDFSILRPAEMLSGRVEIVKNEIESVLSLSERWRFIIITGWKERRPISDAVGHHSW